MEFLDEQGVQPCGHKAREKGILIKVVASCMFNEIPTQYCYSMSGTYTETETEMMVFRIAKQLLETQTTTSIDSSLLNCNSQTIDESCTLPPGLTWGRREEMKKKSPVEVKRVGLIAKIVPTLYN